MGRSAGSFFAIILRTISESPKNMEGFKSIVKSSCFTLNSILAASTALETSDCGADKADFPMILAKLVRRLTWFVDRT